MIRIVLVAIGLFLISLNGQAAEQGSPYLKLKEVLRFGGGDASSEYLWSDALNACDFDVDQAGHFYVLDQRNAAILEFDEKGSFLRHVAKQGDGPGEYRGAASFAVLGDGTAIGLDSRIGSLKVNYYQRGVSFRDSNTLSGAIVFLFKAGFSQELAVLQAIKRSDNNSLFMSYELSDHLLKTKKVISKVAWPAMDFERLGDPAYWVDFLAGQIKAVWAITGTGVGFMEDGRVVIANGKKGTCEIWSPSADKHLKTIVTGTRPMAFKEAKKKELVDSITTILFKQMGPSIQSVVTTAVLKKAIDRADLPEVQSPIYEIIPIEGDIFAAVNQANYASGALEMDIIDCNKGRLAHMVFPAKGVFSFYGTRLKFKHGHAFAMVRNEDDENQIVSYSYRLGDKPKARK